MRNILWVGCLVVLVGCSGSSTTSDLEEIGQQIGDVVASIDEMGGNDGGIALVTGEQRTLARLAPPSWWAQLLPEAWAVNCSSSTTFGSCSSNTITRTLAGCTVAGTVFTGSVVLAWGGSSTSCTMQAFGDTITRSPSFTVTGRRGATLTVSKTGTYGQKLTRAAIAGGYDFTSDGIRRVFTAGGSTLFDYTTTSTTHFPVNGSGRNGRTLTSGSIDVTNNLTGNVCSYTPNTVTWVSTCNCPTTGSWTGNCTGNVPSTLTLSGCGTARLTVGEESTSLTMDRCYET